MTWPVTYYRDRSGFEPADAFIDGIEPPSHRAMVDDYIERLAIFGPDLNFPSCSHVRGDLWELRPDGGRTHYRILYFRTRNVFVLLHAFIKPDGPIAEREIRIAEDRLDDLRMRMAASPRRPPRPIGHDAP
jgi:phage-related protein